MGNLVNLCILLTLNALSFCFCSHGKLTSGFHASDLSAALVVSERIIVFHVNYYRAVNVDSVVPHKSHMCHKV